MNEKNEFANQFIDLWQENFEKMLGSDANMRQMQQMLENMKGFYAANSSAQTNQPSASANSDAYELGDVVAQLSAIGSRLDELERRLRSLEQAGR